ncbi:MAG: HD domain-containing protein [Deltaproteobacteria bacterium]|nr:HD domain-containing protein [Deltaproteobacteria bacterium]
MHIRDPIHGTILLSPAELDLVETPVFQRLRGIKQLGFADHAFPGATHSRFAHSLGAMEMATRIFDAIFPADGCSLPGAERKRFRQLLRLAVLMHDLGHAPLSHATEGCMPARRTLDLPLFSKEDGLRQANHEDYTTLLLLRSKLTALMRLRFVDEGITPEDVAHLITGVCAKEAHPLEVGGVDYGPLMRQIVSGELDADRMDYLQRDSYHAGVDYGRFDRDWLLSNVDAHVEEGKAFLALHHRAIFAFEDFLLSRYHMFVSVYYHHTSVGFDAMLSRFVEAQAELTFPVDAAAYVGFDDVAFWSLLRASKDPWAQRIVQRNLYRRVLELNAADDHDELAGFEHLLAERGVDYFVSSDEGVLSRYYAVGEQSPIFVLNRQLGRATRVDRYSKLYERYAQPARLTRIYCRPDQVREARECAAAP